MIGEIISLIVVRGPLAFAIIINDQITRQPHQPVLQIALARIVLIQRAVNSNKNFLRQIFSSVGARGKAIGQIVDAPGIVMNNLLPGRPVTGATLTNQIGSFVGSQNSCSPHFVPAPPNRVAIVFCRAPICNPLSQRHIRRPERESSPAESIPLSNSDLWRCG